MVADFAEIMGEEKLLKCRIQVSILVRCSSSRELCEGEKADVRVTSPRMSQLGKKESRDKVLWGQDGAAGCLSFLGN